MWHPRSTHLSSLRWQNNAGINIPLCQTRAKLVDMDSTRRKQTRDRELVTCQKCRKLMEGTPYA